MSGTHGAIDQMPFVDVVAQIRTQLHLGGGVDLAQLHRLLGDNRTSVNLNTQSELRVGNITPTTAELKCTPIGPYFLPAV